MTTETAAAPLMTGITCQVVPGSSMKSSGISVGVDGIGDGARMFIAVSTGKDSLVAIIDGPRFAALSKIFIEAGENATSASAQRAQ